MEKTQENELYGIPAVGPPPLLAYKPESKQAPVRFEKVPVVSTADSSGEQRGQETEPVVCDYCQQPSKPFSSREELENNPDMELLFCCEWALKMRVFLMEVERTLAAAALNRKIDVGPHPPFMNRHGKRTAHERPDQRLKEWELQRKLNHNRLLLCKQSTKANFRTGNTICYRLSNEVWTAEQEATIPEMEITDSLNTLSLDGRASQTVGGAQANCRGTRGQGVGGRK